MNWPILERHRRAAAEAMAKLTPYLQIDADEERWSANGGERAPDSFKLAAQLAANTEGEERVRWAMAVELDGELDADLYTDWVMDLLGVTREIVVDWAHQYETSGLGDPDAIRALVLKGWV